MNLIVILLILSFLEFNLSIYLFFFGDESELICLFLNIKCFLFLFCLYIYIMKIFFEIMLLLKIYY